MLTSLRLRNFKSVADQRVELAPLTLFLGANASRKRDIFDALRFLRALASGLRADEVLHSATRRETGVEPDLRGGDSEGSGTSELSIETTWALPEGNLSYRVTVDTDPEPAILAEEIGIPGREALRFDQQNRDPELQHRSILGNGQLPSSSLISAIQRAVQSLVPITVFVPAGRGHPPRVTYSPGTQGENLWATARALCRNEERKAELLHWFSMIWKVKVIDVEFSEADDGEVNLTLVEWAGTQGGNHRLPARRLPESIREDLGFAVEVLSAPEGAVVLMEESDDPHPGLGELIEGVARAGAVQILAATSSRWWHCFLSDEAFGDAIAVGRDLGTSTTVMRRLRDLPHFAEIARREGMEYEYLFTTDWLRTR